MLVLCIVILCLECFHCYVIIIDCLLTSFDILHFSTDGCINQSLTYLLTFMTLSQETRWAYSTTAPSTTRAQLTDSNRQFKDVTEIYLRSTLVATEMKTEEFQLEVHIFSLLSMGAFFSNLDRSSSI